MLHVTVEYDIAPIAPSHSGHMNNIMTLSTSHTDHFHRSENARYCLYFASASSSDHERSLPTASAKFGRDYSLISVNFVQVNKIRTMMTMTKRHGWMCTIL